MHRIRQYARFLTFSLIFFSLWFPGCSTDPVETDLLLPVDFSNVPENMVLTDFHTDKIEIRIQADPQLMDLINKKNIQYPVDLYTDLEFDPAGDSDSIEPGAYLIPVEEKRIPMDPAIQILSIKPSFLSVQLEKKIRKTFTITVPYTGTPAKGYIALEAATEPASVELVGSAPLILSIKELKTKPIDLTNANENFKKKIPLDLDNASILSLPAHIIIVSIPIQQQLVSRTIEHIPVQVWNSDARVKIEPPDITIRVKGPFETVSNIEIMDQIYSFIDLKDLLPGVYARHAHINIPVDLIMTAADPQVFTVKIE